MDSYEVRITYSAEKELNALPRSIVSILWDKIRALEIEPRPRQSKKLKGTEKSFRLRIRNYRVIYRIDDEQKLVVIIAVRHRKEVYR